MRSFKPFKSPPMEAPPVEQVFWTKVPIKVKWIQNSPLSPTIRNFCSQRKMNLLKAQPACRFPRHWLLPGNQALNAYR